MTNTVSDNAPFGANSPFFRVIQEGLDGFVDGDDYFDLLAEDVVFEYVISVPGYPRRVQGRQNVIDLYSDYGDYMQLQSAVRTGRPYNNRFVSVVTIKRPQGDPPARLPGSRRRVRRIGLAARPPLATQWLGQTGLVSVLAGGRSES